MTRAAAGSSTSSATPRGRSRNTRSVPPSTATSGRDVRFHRPLLRPTRPAPVDLDSEECRPLRAIAAGRNTLDAAEELHVSERTVKRMTAALLRKLRVSNRAEAAAVAGQTGLLTE
ncbi:response regulator transcription factor [Micromonospora profundi]|uniref:response regulator transcription factor n=1 Tax=Micromonospora profundi TaxID=1420889 RepID=UPI0036663621